MMQFQIRAMKSGQAPSWFALEADSAVEAATQLEHQGYVVLATKVRKSGGRVFAARGSFSLQLFCEEFYSLFEAGLSVMEVLQLLQDKAVQPSAQQVFRRLNQAVGEGQALSHAMRAQPTIFPGLFVATIQAAETTGDVAEAMQRYAYYLDSVDRLKKKVISATLYPAIVLTVGLLVTLFLLVFVIPKFSHIYQTQLKQLSFSTQCLMWIGAFSQRHALWLVAGGLLAIVSLVMVWQSTIWRQRLAEIAWRLPYIGEMMRIYHLSRFYRTFAMLLKSGIPVVGSMGMMHDLLGARLSQALARARQQVKEGQGLTDALEKAGLTTAVSLRFFHVGEKTGQLHHMMEKAAAYHEAQMARWLDHFAKILEPTLMTLLGLFIGGIVLMMYLPIFELAAGLD